MKNLIYSSNPKRNEIYCSFLETCQLGQKTVQDIIRLLHKLMRQTKCHPHFFGNNSLLETAHYLTFFALKLPYEYQNPLYQNLILTSEAAINIISLGEKRIAEKIPVEYLTQQACYLGNTFFVNEHVLVPRSIMSARFKDFLQNMHWENYRVLDLCTGSGCIGISLALLHPGIQVDLADISQQALAVAAINIDKYSLQNRVRCIQGDLFENIHDKYDLIITNPPYVSTSEYKNCSLEFKNEPALALESGWDGLTIIHKILTQAQHHLNQQGQLIAEVGFYAAKRLKRRYPSVLFKWFGYKKPNGKEPLLAMDCGFICEAKNLPKKPPEIAVKTPRAFFRWIDKIKDFF